MQNLNDILKNFAFSEAEAELYAAALKLNKATVSQIAQKAGMGRTVAYFHIKNLIEKKIFRDLKRGRQILIIPIPPAELAELLQKKVGDFKTLIPQMEALDTIEKEIPQIEIQESYAGFDKIYDEICHLPVGGLFKVIEDMKGGEAEMHMMGDKNFNTFLTQIYEKKILTRAIFTEELVAQINRAINKENYSIVQKRMWDIHVLPEEKLSIKNLILLYNDKVSFLFPEISLTITIKHKTLFGIINTLFETIFGLAHKVDNPWGKIK